MTQLSNVCLSRWCMRGSRKFCQRRSNFNNFYINILFWACLSGAVVTSMSGVVLGGVVMVVGSNLARGKIFTASIATCKHQSSSISALPEHPFLGMSQWHSW